MFWFTGKGTTGEVYATYTAEYEKRNLLKVIQVKSNPKGEEITVESL